MSCERENENNPDTRLDLIKGMGYLPLGTGNYWKLSNLSERLIDTIVNIEGTDYYRLVSVDTIYYRKTGDGKIYKRTKNTTEILKFDLSAEVLK